MPDLSYVFNATVLRWVDGDTVDLHVDLGFHVTMTGRFRLRDVDTPERGRSGWQAATDRVNALAPVGSRVRVETHKPGLDKYGRFLADVFLPDQSCVNSILLDEGLAFPYGFKEFHA